MAGFSFRLLAIPRSAWGSPLPLWPAVALMAPRGSPSPTWPDTLRRRVPGGHRRHHGRPTPSWHPGVLRRPHGRFPFPRQVAVFRRVSGDHRRHHGRLASQGGHRRHHGRLPFPRQVAVFRRVPGDHRRHHGRLAFARRTRKRRGITVAIMAGQTCDLYTGSSVNGIRNKQVRMQFHTTSCLDVIHKGCTFFGSSPNLTHRS